MNINRDIGSYVQSMECASRNVVDRGAHGPSNLNCSLVHNFGLKNVSVSLNYYHFELASASTSDTVLAFNHSFPVAVPGITYAVSLSLSLHSFPFLPPIHEQLLNPPTSPPLSQPLLWWLIQKGRRRRKRRRIRGNDRYRNSRNI